MFCHKCGAQIAEEAGFCHKCGAKIVPANELNTNLNGYNQNQGANRPQTAETLHKQKENQANWYGGSFTEPTEGTTVAPLPEEGSVIKVKPSYRTRLARAGWIVAIVGIILLLPIFNGLGFSPNFFLGFAGSGLIMTTVDAVRPIKVKKIVQGILGLIFIIVAIVATDLFRGENPLTIVKTGTLPDYPETPVGAAFDNFLANSEWSEWERDDNTTIVTVLGIVSLNNEDVELITQFAVGRGDSDFSLFSIGLDGKPILDEIDQKEQLDIIYAYTAELKAEDDLVSTDEAMEEEAARAMIEEWFLTHQISYEGSIVNWPGREHTDDAYYFEVEFILESVYSPKQSFFITVDRSTGEMFVDDPGGVAQPMDRLYQELSDDGYVDE